MPTWPSANKAVTTYTDQGSDRLADARPEINKTIANVNDIIDTFAISSPSNGDLLQYSTSTGAWEQVAVSTVGSQISVANATTSTLYPSTAGTLDRYPNWQEDDDPDGIMSISNGKFTLSGSGSFLITCSAMKISDAPQVFFRNETTTTNLVGIQTIPTSPQVITAGSFTVIQATTTQYSIVINNSGSQSFSSLTGEIQLSVVKFA
jgi:hypothetical protein